MKPELKSKIITWGMCGCAVLYVLNYIISLIVSRTFFMVPSYMIKTLISAILPITLSVSMYLCFALGSKTKKLPQVGFLLMIISGGYNVYSSITSTLKMGYSNQMAMMGVILAIVNILVAIVCFVNHRKKGAISKFTAVALTFGGVIAMANLFLGQSTLMGMRKNAFGTIVLITYVVLFWTIMIYDACKVNQIVISNKPSEQNFVKSSPFSIYVIALAIIALCGIMAMSPSKPSGGSSDKPWKELGVSESEYWKVYKDIYDKSR